MKVFKVSIVVACAVVVAACGGGGESGGSVSPPPSPTTPSIPLITAPIAPPSGVDAEAVAAFNLLNAETSRCGFGMKNWSAPLAVAALGHADWQLLNNYQSHFQIAGTPGFTGVGFEDRLALAGLSGFSGTDEISSVLGTNAKAGEGAKRIRALLSAPYHAFGMIGGFTDIGIAVRNATEAGSVHGPRVVLQANLTYQTSSGPQRPAAIASNEVRTYPCEGTAGTRFNLTNEDPNPLPGRNLATSPIGHPIMVETPVDGGVVVVTSASVTPSGGAAVALLPTLTASSDVNGLIKANQAVLMPNLPLTPATTYSVSVVGTVNGNPFSRTFSFTTGS